MLGSVLHLRESHYYTKSVRNFIVLHCRVHDQKVVTRSPIYYIIYIYWALNSRPVEVIDLSTLLPITLPYLNFDFCSIECCTASKNGAGFSKMLIRLVTHASLSLPLMPKWKVSVRMWKILPSIQYFGWVFAERLCPSGGLPQMNLRDCWSLRLY